MIESLNTDAGAICSTAKLRARAHSETGRDNERVSAGLFWEACANPTPLQPHSGSIFIKQK